MNSTFISSAYAEGVIQKNHLICQFLHEHAKELCIIALIEEKSYNTDTLDLS